MNFKKRFSDLFQESQTKDIIHKKTTMESTLTLIVLLGSWKNHLEKKQYSNKSNRMYLNVTNIRRLEVLNKKFAAVRE